MSDIEVNSRITSMPPEIASAIVQVMGEITTVATDGRNKFANYDYMSVDACYALIGPLLAKAGIFDVSFENKMEVVERETIDDRGNLKKSVWLNSVYDVYIFHKTGVSYGPIPRTIQVVATGAQAYAASISFMKKYFWRDLLKIPTGDPDPDSQEKHELPSRSKTPPKPPQAAASNITDDQMRELGRMITVCGKGTWERFATVFEVKRLGDVLATKYDDCVLWLKGTKEWQSRAGLTQEDPVAVTGKRTPPNPNAPAPDKPPQGQQKPFDYEGALVVYREAVKAAESEDKLDEIYNRLIEPLMGSEAPQGFFDEAKSIDDERRGFMQN